ncbi:hypothetical protein [Streptomyces sp. NPDC056549]|uniref:hypothetical protein n=1 Tax=Streptomyces sp. NPDC056549 TaxID=3345864 RepID=UPI0036810EAD
MALPDWWDDLYGPDEERPAPDDTTVERRSWLTVRDIPEPEPQPGIHVTITPTAPPTKTSGPRKARIRWWVLRRGTAAAVGYYVTGLGPLVQSLLDTAGLGAIGFAAFLWLGAWRLATWALRLVPRDAIQEVHDGADWAAHIPSATILLALALHTPGVPQ